MRVRRAAGRHLFSLFVLRDAPATPVLIGGASLVIGALAVPAQSSE
ncbi:MAG: hypothetical protein ACRD2I_25655 [Vicinamibacterales bacterium]